MKLFKYIISLCIIFVGMLIIGESRIFSLDNFYTEFANTTMYLQPNTTEKEMLNDILNSADKNKVEVFTFKKSSRSAFFTQYDIYGTKGVEKLINQHLNIFEQKYKSLFLGRINFSFYDFKKLRGIESIRDFYITGSKKHIHKFKMDLINKYAGNHPKEGYENTELRNTIVGIWVLITSIILLLTYFEVKLQKKEIFIQVSLGARISNIIWKNILLDSGVLLLLILFILYFLYKFTNVFFRIDISITFIIILLFLNSLLYINLYFYNVNKVFSNVKGSKNLLSLSYYLKLVTAIITIFIISSNIALINDSLSLYKQQSFFEKHKDYYYTRIEYRLIENSDGTFKNNNEDSNIQATFYREFFEKFNAILLANISELRRENSILANKNALNYLSSKIKELKGFKLIKDIYFLIPEKSKNDPNIIDDLKETIRFYEGNNFIYDYKVIYYKDNVEIISIDENNINGSELIKNPIIIYNNMSATKLQKQKNEDLQKINYLHDIMYKISKEEFNSFIKNHDMKDQSVTKTNILDSFNTKWKIERRILYINSIFSLLVLCLEFIIISTIIKMEYEVNSIEISIKKVLGHSLIERNSKIILMTIFTNFLSVLVAIFISIFTDFKEIYYLAIGGIVLLILELFVILCNIHKIENSKIQKILKGGNI